VKDEDYVRYRAYEGRAAKGVWTTKRLKEIEGLTTPSAGEDGTKAKYQIEESKRPAAT